MGRNQSGGVVRSLQSCLAIRQQYKPFVNRVEVLSANGVRVSFLRVIKSVDIKGDWTVLISTPIFLLAPRFIEVLVARADLLNRFQRFGSWNPETLKVKDTSIKSKCNEMPARPCFLGTRRTSASLAQNRDAYPVASTS